MHLVKPARGLMGSLWLLCVGDGAKDRDRNGKQLGGLPNCGQDQGSYRGSVEKWSDYRDILEVESTGFPARVGVACESEGGALQSEGSPELVPTERERTEGGAGFVAVFSEGQNEQFSFRCTKFKMPLRTANWTC